MNAHHNKAPAIVVRNLLFAYPGRASEPVLEIPHWQVAAGQQVFVRGPSGCGKSTLLNLLVGILTPLDGAIEVLGENIGALGAHRRDRFRARHIGIVFQQFNLIPYLSVMDNIRLAAHFGTRDQKQAVRRTPALIEALQLPGEVLNVRADRLSVGQQQRVAIARALINEPELLIVDEPTSALDETASAAFMELLLELSRRNQSTLLFVSHDQRLAHAFDEVLHLPYLKRGGERHVA